MPAVDMLLDFPSDRTPEEPVFVDLDPDIFKTLLSFARGVLPPSALQDLPDIQRKAVLTSADLLEMTEFLKAIEDFEPPTRFHVSFPQSNEGALSSPATEDSKKSPTHFQFRFSQSNDYAMITNEGTVYTASKPGYLNTVLGDRQLPPAGRFYWEVKFLETSGWWDYVGLAESGVVTTDDLRQPGNWAWASIAQLSWVVTAGSASRFDELPFFRPGLVVGVDVDMDRGTLSFWADGQFLGLAAHGLKGKELFPAFSVESTTVMQLRTGLAPPDLVSSP